MDWGRRVMNVTSQYPGVIDEMSFFQDNDIDSLGAMNTYDNLIRQGRYSEANAYIDQHGETFGFFADLLNAMENRIYNLQEYLLTKQKKNPFVLSEEEPETVAEGAIWI